MRIFIIGINGKMGKTVALCAEQLGHTVAGGIDISACDKYPVFSRAEDVNIDFDVIIDFSRPETLDTVIALSVKSGKPVVIATTGYSEKQLSAIGKLSKSVAVFKTANMSLGVNAVASALKQLTVALGGYDIEIIEAHHNQKVDAPSGTAKLLLSSVESALGFVPEVVNGRSGDKCKRKDKEIGMHALRGGTIIGEHTVMFAGDDEIIEIKHTALSRKIFANGAIAAAHYIADKKCGIYDMNDYLSAHNA